MSQELSLGEMLGTTASGDPIDGFSCERRMSSACTTHGKHAYLRINQSHNYYSFNVDIQFGVT